MTTSRPLIIATRQSRLALWQAEHVRALLERRGQAVRILGLTTRGDQILDRALSQVGGKALFVKELEAALQDGRADLAVHSLKDVPMQLPDGLTLACVLEREDSRDALVVAPGGTSACLADVPPGALLGTSSLRRQALLRALRPDVRIAPLRGNINTRLARLDAGGFDAIVLAAAGLARLGLQARIRSYFAPQDMLPAAGQGALAVEVRSDRTDLLAALAPLAHRPSWLATVAERAVSRCLGGNCSVPLAAYARFEHSAGALPRLVLQAAWGDPEGRQPLLRVQVSSSAASLDFAEADALGQEAAARLLAAGAQVSTHALGKR